MQLYGDQNNTSYIANQCDESLSKFIFNLSVDVLNSNKGCILLGEKYSDINCTFYNETEWY